MPYTRITHKGVEMYVRDDQILSTYQALNNQQQDGQLQIELEKDRYKAKEDGKILNAILIICLLVYALIYSI